MKTGENSIQLTDGSRVAVIGSGPAGSLFGYFFLDLCDRVGLRAEVDLYDPRIFPNRGPSGCNMCGGIVSESLVQTLAAEGINLPSTVVQRGIDAYVLHTDIGSVRIETPVQEKRIAAVHRGGGPRKEPAAARPSFDAFLQSLAVEKGARPVNEAVVAIEHQGDRRVILTKSGESAAYDLLVVATGVNATARKILDDLSPNYRQPKITKTAIREFYLGEDGVSSRFGDAMHLFLLKIPRLEFSALIPKGDCVTFCMLGEDIDRDLLETFLGAPAVKTLLPDNTFNACACAPRMSLSAAARPYADRIVCVGDCAVSRLYKDGIGAAYRTAKAAAKAAVFHGISSGDFRDHYLPACRSIATDNRFGKLIFFVTRQIQQHAFAQRAVLKMVRREQEGGRPQRMSTILWDTFTGSAPYRDIVKRTLHPSFLATLGRHMIGSIVRRENEPEKTYAHKST